MRFLRRITTTLFITLAALLSACAGGASSESSGVSGPVTLRLAYFPNITHAQPLVGLGRGTYAEALGSDIKLETRTFNAGPAVIEALFANAIDASYIGPSPAVNGYVRSGGKELRIIAGATSGGASLVVRGDSGINSPADFAGKKVATPQLANTQDVALRTWLHANGLKDREHGGSVQVIPTANADALALFLKGELHAAWVPEPWATRLVLEAGGRVFLDERDLWPNREFVTTQLVVRTKFLEEHPEAVERLLRAHVAETQWINEHPDEAKRLLNEGIKKVTSAALPDAVIDAAWRTQEITFDPIASSLRKSADDAFALGFLGEKKPDLANIYALELLNKVLGELDLAPVQG